MKPHRVLGFKATANAGYDCSFMVSYPVDAPVQSHEVRQACEQAVNDASRMHGGITVHGQVETVIMK